MKVLCLKCYTWLLLLNQRARIDFLGHIWYEALAKHIKPFFEKRSAVSRLTRFPNVNVK